MNFRLYKDSIFSGECVIGMQVVEWALCTLVLSMVHLSLSIEQQKQVYNCEANNVCGEYSVR